MVKKAKIFGMRTFHFENILIILSWILEETEFVMNRQSRILMCSVLETENEKAKT